MTTREWILLIWALLGGTVLACLVVTLRSRGRLTTLGAVVSRIRAHRVGRLLFTLGWMWLGWHAFAR
jgi:hypothetical protein